MEKELNKLLIYKLQAEEKKPREIQACMRTYLALVYRTNQIVRQLEISQKYSGMSMQVLERMQITTTDTKEIVVKGFDEIMNDQDKLS